MNKLHYSFWFAFLGLSAGTIFGSILISMGVDTSEAIIDLSIDYPILEPFLDTFNVAIVGTLLLTVLGAWYGFKRGEGKDQSVIMTGSQESLSRLEKILFWVVSLVISPIIPFTVVYYVCKRTYPKKVYEAYKIFWITLPIFLLLRYTYSLLPTI